MDIITAKNNPKIKETKALLTSSKDRKEASLFVLEGVRLCVDAVKTGCEIVNVFCTENCMKKYRDEVLGLKNNCKGFFAVSEDVLKNISDTVSPQGVVCTVKMKQNTFEYENCKKYIALDTIQNPDNLGAISRTAEALGVDGLIIFGGCDIYNPKALRASMGSLLRLPIKLTDNLLNDLAACEKAGIDTFATVPDRDAKDITTLDFSKGALCVIGNEGNGVSQSVIDACKDKITIKMLGRAESLNAATAASITMWELVK